MSQDRPTDSSATDTDVPRVSVVHDLTVEPVPAPEPAAAADEATTELVPGMVTVLEPAAAEAVVEQPPQQGGYVDPFDVVFRGYDRHQVDGHLQRLAVAFDELRAAYADADRRATETALELDRTRAELERGRPSFDALGERVSQMLGLAETEAAQLRADAEREVAEQRAAAERAAADIRSDARREAEELGASARREVSELSRHRVELLSEIATTRDTLNGILGSAGEQWPSLAPAEEPTDPSDLSG